LEKNQRFIRLELPGFGYTQPPPSSNASVNDVSHFVNDAIEGLGIKKFFILGHSYGGALALNTARITNNNCAGIILLNSIGVSPHRAFRPEVLIRYASQLTHSPLFEPIATSVGVFVYRYLLGFPKSYGRKEIRRAIEVVSFVNFDEFKKNVPSDLPTFHAYAKRDPLVEVGISREFNEYLGTGPRIEYPIKSHNIQRDCAEDLSNKINDWISSLNL